MKAKHTPGPWKFTQSKSCVRVSSEFEEFGDLATVWEYYGNAEANAMLIAAAPELLEASIQFRRSVMTGDYDALPTMDALAILDAAIAKATGA